MSRQARRGRRLRVTVGGAPIRCSFVVREEHLERLHEQADSEAGENVEERLDRKRVS